MSLAAGAASLVSVGQTTASISVATPSSAGTAPYTYQWYRSTTTGFSPGGGTLISGATTRAYVDTGLIPGTQYFYVNVVTDSASPAATANSTQLSVATTNQVPNQNQFAQTAQVGQVDMPYNYDTIPVQIDVTQSGVIYAGQAVKLVASSSNGAAANGGTGQVPKVIACAANSDECFGFINYNQKNVSFAAGQACEISQAGNVMYLWATAAIVQGAQVQLDLSTVGGVAPKGSAGNDYVGWAFDGAAAAGALIRVRLVVPSFTKFS